MNVDDLEEKITPYMQDQARKILYLVHWLHKYLAKLLSAISGCNRLMNIRL